MLRHTSNHDSHIGVAAATVLPLGVLSVYIQESLAIGMHSDI